MQRREGRHAPEHMVGLTERQRTVVKLIARGRTNFQIAQELGISLEGAKYHVREVMARFGAESREEAAAAWVADNRAERRVIRRVGVFVGGVTVRAATVVLAASGALVALGIWQFVQRGPGADDAVRTAALPDRLRTDSTPVLAGSTILQQGTPVAFDQCYKADDWALPPISELFSNPLVGTGGSPALEDVANFLSPFHYLGEAPSIADATFMALWGRNSGNGRPDAKVACPQPRVAGDEEVAVSGYRVIEMKRDGAAQLAVSVAPAPGTFEIVRFHGAPRGYDPQDRDPSPRAFALVQFVDPEGRVIGEAGLDFSRWSGAADGTLVAALVRPETQWVPIENAAVPARVVAYAAAGTSDAIVVLVDSNGHAAARFPLAPVTSSWARAATIALPAGTYGLAVLGSNPVLLVREGLAP